MTNNTINRKVLLWIKEGYTQKTIQNRLEKEGISFDSSSEIYQIVFNEFKAEKTKKTIIIWSSISVLALLIHLFLIPVNVLYNSAYLINILIGLTVGICVLQTICRFEDLHAFFEMLGQKNNAPIDKLKKKQFPFVFILPISGIILTSSLYFLRVNNEFKAHGKTVTAIVLDGYSNTSKSIRRTTTSNVIMYRFQTADKKFIDGSSSVSSSYFNSLFKGMEIKITYSTRFPEMNKLSKIDASSIK
ncbi:MAG: hypothetical protein HYR91_01805 [Flavobacteriia bacterium]|nr:hypothetical protein [Flavobacteriia bacterium]